MQNTLALFLVRFAVFGDLVHPPDNGYRKLSPLVWSPWLPIRDTTARTGLLVGIDLLVTLGALVDRDVLVAVPKPGDDCDDERNEEPDTYPDARCHRVCSGVEKTPQSQTATHHEGQHGKK